MQCLKVASVCLSLIVVCAATAIHDLQTYKAPIKHVQGLVLDPTGSVLTNVDVTAFDHPEVWSDDSLNFSQKRAKQVKVAATRTDEDGRFSLKNLAKGRYEIEFSRSGFDILSTLVKVDPGADPNRYCVTLAVSSTSGKGSFKPCGR
jgi:hypothetical protein